jgi:hypothetical protein
MIVRLRMVPVIKEAFIEESKLHFIKTSSPASNKTDA